MTESFNRPGAIDLSSLAAQAKASHAPAAPAAGGGNFVTTVTEAGLEQFVELSLQHPVVLELWSPRAQGGEQLSAVLAELTNAAGGDWLLGRVNVDVETRIAQALQVQAVPFVLALVGGQPLPLFQGTRSREEIADLMSQVVQAARANGIVGKARPVADAGDGSQSAPADAPAPVDPRFEAADAALEAGDYAKAVEEFDKLLKQTPGDPEVIAGRAQASLLQRTLTHNPQTVFSDADARPDDREAQFAAADVELVTGQVEAAFQRLLALVSASTGDDREAVRVRLVELFTVIGPTDERVVAARRQLSRALF